MKKVFTILVILPLILLAFRSADEKPANISYEKRIKPIMNMYCVDCHSQSPSSNNYSHPCDLSNYDSLKTYVLNGSIYDHVYVKKDMPASRGWSLSPRMDSASLNVLDSWIKAGAPFE